MANNRLCIGCEHFQIDFGTSNWSELTPGDPPYLRCGKAVLDPDIEPYDLSRDAFRKLLHRAKQCPEYSFRALPPEPEPTFTQTFDISQLPDA